MSQQVNLATRGGAWKRIFPAANTTASAFVTGGLQGKAYPLNNQTMPWVDAAGLRIVNVDGGQGLGGTARLPGPSGNPVPNAVDLMFFGVGANNATANARVWGITEGFDLVGTTETRSLEAAFLCELALLLSNNIVGLDGTLIPTAGVLVDTITLTTGASQDVVITNQGADLRGAHCRVDITGFQTLALELDVGTATSINGLFRFIW